MTADTDTSTAPRPDHLAPLVLDALNAGVYVTDLDRRIIYWNSAAQRLTGWRPQDILGKACHDQVLCHVDKDGRPLCGKEFCPLHRAIMTGAASTVPIVVYALAPDGKRIPMRVTVSPLRDAGGAIIGGVETFLDMSCEVNDLQRAQRIQSQCLLNEASDDPRLRVRMHYAPHDMIGGDFCALSRTGPDRYAFIVADVTGHGLSAALYSMFLRSLWDEQRALNSPAAILQAINRRLACVMSGGGSFATAVCGVLDLARRSLLLSSAGGPAPLLIDMTGHMAEVHMSGLPMGVSDEAEYDLIETALDQSGRLLLVSDGVLEIRDRTGKNLNTNGLLRLLREADYPSAELDVQDLEDRLLLYSNAIRFSDDVTLLEIHCWPQGV